METGRINDGLPVIANPPVEARDATDYQEVPQHLDDRNEIQVYDCFIIIDFKWTIFMLD